MLQHAAPSLPVLLPALTLWHWMRWGCSMLTSIVIRPKKVLAAMLVTAMVWHSLPGQDRPFSTVHLHPIPTPRHKDARGTTTHQHSTPHCFCKILQNSEKRGILCTYQRFLAPVPWPGNQRAAPIHPQAPWPGPVHPQQTCLEQFIPGLSSPPGLLTCPCSALTTVLDWSTWLQQPQLFMVIAELIIK